MPQVFDVLCVKSQEPDWMTATQKQIYNLIFSIVHEKKPSSYGAYFI